MFNADIPNQDQLPSSVQLLRATFVALAVSLVILLAAILPANYGVDPTGMGRVLGLTEMGQIKVSLELEAAAEAEAEAAALAAAEATAQRAAATAVPQEEAEDQSSESAQVEAVEMAQPADVDPVTESEPAGFMPLARNSYTLTLAPAATAEIKVRMNQGDMVLYSWQTESGTINFDNHGDNENISYHNYTKGTFVEGDQGVIEAAFDGSHGWFWRNRGDESITLTLEIQGAYTDPRRLL